MGFGSDFSQVFDFDANWTFLSGDVPETVALTQATARRFLTPRGALPGDPNYGFDLRNLVSDVADPSEIIPLIESEARKDQRCQDCVATITVTGDLPAQTWIINILCTATSGQTYTLTLAVSSVTVELLNTQGAA